MMSEKEISVPETGEVVEQVTKIAAEDTDDLAVMQYLMQAASAAQLIRLRKLEESKIPTGTVKLLRFTVTTETYRLSLSTPWIAFSVINDGPSTVNLWTNVEEDPLIPAGMLLSGESKSLDMGYPVIYSIFAKTISGIAVIRIEGIEGISSNFLYQR